MDSFKWYGVNVDVELISCFMNADISGACCSKYNDELCFVIADENKIEFDVSVLA